MAEKDEKGLWDKFLSLFGLGEPEKKPKPKAAPVVRQTRAEREAAIRQSQAYDYFASYCAERIINSSLEPEQEMAKILEEKDEFQRISDEYRTTDDAIYISTDGSLTPAESLAYKDIMKMIEEMPSYEVKAELRKQFLPDYEEAVSAAVDKSKKDVALARDTRSQENTAQRGAVATIRDNSAGVPSIDEKPRVLPDRGKGLSSMG